MDKFIKYIAAAIVAVLLGACTSDSYDSGDGNFSYLKAEFAVVATDDNLNIISATTDGGSRLVFANPFKQQWASQPDSVYRALLYYDNTGDSIVKARSISPVPVLSVVSSDRVAELTDSPVTLESTWMSASGCYINLSLLLKAGSTDGGAQQTVALVDDGSYDDSSGKRHLTLRLIHDQGTVPDYYTVRQYLSVAVAQLMPADSVDVVVNTHDGTVVKKFCVRN